MTEIQIAHVDGSESFDPAAFAVSFEQSVVDAYRRGVADSELPE